ncbi:hypothetical protein [Granulicella sp. dw_53]|uniref:hypothetical protein n=1 Tax=Granulicella sp. dw_53 TaxID=2719792 RepID=UPI001BD4501A|nr:hypothetical protein [Granulicella sp. dw_53]
MEFSRKEQLASTVTALDEHRKFADSIRKAHQNHSAQTSQLRGLYEEVDKLTKSKSVVPPSDLLVEVVNTQIADAKALIFRDAYLDRLKSFVPAGDNPSYPDILLSLRILQQASERFTSMLEVETDKHSTTGTELQTIAAALRVAEQDEIDFYTEDTNDEEPESSEMDENEDSASEEDDSDATDSDDAEDEEEDSEPAEEDVDSDENQTDEYDEYIRKSEVKAKVDGLISETWFKKYDDVLLFDFEKLDRIGIPLYESPRDGITFEPHQK